MDRRGDSMYGAPLGRAGCANCMGERAAKVSFSSNNEFFEMLYVEEQVFVESKAVKEMDGVHVTCLASTREYCGPGPVTLWRLGSTP
jgi:hypothetical protein